MSAHLPDYSYLDEDDTQDGLDDMDLSERDTALVVALPHLDYESQLKAIRVVLGSHREAEKKHAADIETGRATRPKTCPLRASSKLTRCCARGRLCRTTVD